MRLGEQVKKLRKSLGLTQKQFAARIPGRGDDTHIGRIERGKGYPSIKFLVKAAETYQVPVGYFFLEDPPARLEDLDAYLSVISEARELLHSWLRDQLPEFAASFLRYARSL